LRHAARSQDASHEHPSSLRKSRGLKRKGRHGSSCPAIVLQNRFDLVDCRTMGRKHFIVVALGASLAWGAPAQQDAKSVVETVAKAMGAENLGSIRYSGSGLNFAVGQAPNPSSPWPKFNVKT